MTIKYLIDSGKPSLQTLIEDYAVAQAKLQTVVNPSGDLTNGSGLAEPKFYPNGTAFLGEWGRPQRDGPALRATALISFANDRLALGHTDTVKNILWPIISNDLSYVAQYWNNTGFDLWEEINGTSFFTTAVQHRALVEGSALAAAIGESCAACDGQAPHILCFQQSYWNGKDAIVSNTNVQYEDYNRTGLDCASILASIHTFDPTAGCDSMTFQPCSDRALANHKAVVDSFRTEYSINSAASAGLPAAVGRYPEDSYQGGNPWYLCTFAAAEQLYDASYQYNQTGTVAVTDVSLPFFTDLNVSVKAGSSYARDSAEFQAVQTALRTYADGFAALAASHAAANGSIAEQFSRENGFAESARDLTWSYASFLTMKRARDGLFGRGWGAAGSNTLPETCGGGGQAGTYAAATATVFPQSEEGTWSGAGNSTATAAAATPSSAGNRLRPFFFC